MRSPRMNTLRLSFTFKVSSLVRRGSFEDVLIEKSEGTQAGGHFMPAIRFQMFAAGFQGMREMEPGDRSAAALAVPVV